MIWNGSYDKPRPEATFTHGLVIPIGSRNFTTLLAFLQVLLNRKRIAEKGNL